LEKLTGFMEQKPHFIHIPLHLGGLDLSVTNDVVMLWLAAALTFVIMVIGARRLASGLNTTNRFTLFVEAMIEFVRENITGAFLGENAAKWFPFVAALFFFVLFNNLLGKVPLPWYVVTTTGNINVTAALAIMVFVVAQVVGVVKLGPVTYFKKKFLIPAPRLIQIPAILIMLLVLLAEPLSLAVRLFANMLAGHMVMGLVTAGGLFFVSHSNPVLRPVSALPFVIVVAMQAFELFIAFIQAFIFALLSSLYLSESLEEHH
jgi:F-type H+-transporting ATPase subunit a